jgi:hypothetical protein
VAGDPPAFLFALLAPPCPQLLKWNCNHFTSELSVLLTGEGACGLEGGGRPCSPEPGLGAAGTGQGLLKAALSRSPASPPARPSLTTLSASPGPATRTPIPTPTPTPNPTRTPNPTPNPNPTPTPTPDIPDFVRNQADEVRGAPGGAPPWMPRRARRTSPRPGLQRRTPPPPGHVDAARPAVRAAAAAA